MRVIGGELELQKLEEQIIYTDSGRSSLKLLLNNGYTNKKFLLPDYFCEVIEKTLQKANVKYDFYHIKEDLSIDVDSLKTKEFDIFYAINYFGVLQDLSQCGLEEKIVIEDCVFFQDFTNRYNFKHWFAFNSFRKTTPLADGSLIKTTLGLERGFLNTLPAPFSVLKNKAKEIKYEYLCNQDSNYSENDYLSLFEKGEKVLDEQNDIYSISFESIYRLNKFEKNQIRKERFDTLLKMFAPYCVNKEANEYSFFVLTLPHRDILQKHLRDKKIYLPIHWPRSSQQNKLYDTLISIPLFETYDDEAFAFMMQQIKENL